jgi:hypothetical protein
MGSVIINEEFAYMISRITGSIVRRGLSGVLAVALASALFQGTGVQAGPISGSDGFSQQNAISITALPSGSSVSNATSFGDVALATSAPATGDFTAIPANTDVGSGITVPVHTGASSFTFGDMAFGHFVATSEKVIFQGNGFANLQFNGSFTPGTDFPGKTASAAEFNISFTQTGASISDSGTLATSVPEPTSMALLGIGISSFIAFRRRFSKKLPVA